MTSPLDAFIEAACVPRDQWHSSGTLERSEAIRVANPEVASGDIHTAAILGDDVGVRRFLALDPANATAKGGPYGWDALTHLCFSRYLRLDPARSDGFLRAATALLDAGASATTGWQENDHEPKPTWECVLYGAAGIAHHPELTRLLIERGADPNDDEAAYHSPESFDNRAMHVLLDTGKLTESSLSMMLLRKHDWHDYDGAKLVLEHGANPNLIRRWGLLPMHHALARDNALEMFELLLDYGADPALQTDGRSAVARAARQGRSDVLALFEQRGFATALHGVDALIAACARANWADARAIVGREPKLVDELLAVGGSLLAKFAGTGNSDGVGMLLDAGVEVTAPFTEGDGYFGIPKDSLAIHVAAWRGRPAVVRVLIARGSPVDLPDLNGRTPLALAVRACVDSYWTERRTPESARILLEAGASVNGISYPAGYAEVDELLRSYGSEPR